MLLKSIDFSKGVRTVCLKILILVRAFAMFDKHIDFSKGIRAFCFRLVSKMSKALRASVDFELLPTIKSLKC